MRWVKYAAWVTIPLLAGAVAYSLRSGGLLRQWAVVTQSAPVMDYTSVVDLGPREIGTVAHGQVTIANRGGGELLVEQIRSSCGCAGLERAVGDKLQQVETLRLGPGEKAELVVRVSVRGEVNQPYRFVLTARTNDPTRPEAAVEVVIPKVGGGITTTPATVAFGKVVVGDTARQTLDLFDSAAKPRKVVKVATVDPERLSARLMPVPDSSSEEARSQAGRLIGRVEVTLRGDRPGPAGNELRIELDEEGRGPQAVSVSGQVVPPVEVIPQRLTLPRSSGTGPVYYAQCVCRCAKGEAVVLRPSSVPAGLRVDISDAVEVAGTRVVRVEWDPSQDVPGAASSRQVRLEAEVEGRTVELVILVECLTQRG